MAKVFVIVEDKEDWTPYYPAEKLLTPTQYLVHWEELEYSTSANEKIKIINLCKNYKYLGHGYYCSLLAEARGHNVIPSVKTLSNLAKSSLYNLEIEGITEQMQKYLKKQEHSEFEIIICFGKTQMSEFQDLARQIFDSLPTPIMRVTFSFENEWSIDAIKSVALSELSDSEQDFFANSLDHYSNKVWKKPRSKKKYRYDLAILYNPLEELPPSDKKALKNFIRVGKDYNVNVELVEKSDYSSLAEYDGLFIRETTAINHHTYKFAKKAESENMIVIDDSLSILRCTNKVFLANLLKENNLSAPKSYILSKEEFQQHKLHDLFHEIDFPIIIKIPDGAFSKGVVKAKSEEEFNQTCKEFFKKSSLILIQEYLYTDYDWRIGVLGGKPIFACKYFMSKGHWQIYNHKASKKHDETGDAQAFPISKVPRYIISAATKAANLIGNGLYGVDLKEQDGKAYIIEVNDNPNIDFGIEDAVAGDDLYKSIILEFINRIEGRV